ncbi:MAG: hypothetical protein GY913_19260 [Proteobacteria bacterium]|nr:hypothetical protein [Pseudomonadota bacterium]MCP4919049.1 hypothetical protein [Pseudomonadota bacterium]
MTAIVERTAWVGALKDVETFALSGRLEDGEWHDLAFPLLSDNESTGESMRPDLEHPGPIKPHWDYKDGSGAWHRVFPDGTSEAKK